MVSLTKKGIRPALYATCGPVGGLTYSFFDTGGEVVFLDVTDYHRLMNFFSCLTWRMIYNSTYLPCVDR